MAVRSFALVGLMLVAASFGSEVQVLDSETGEWVPDGDLVYKFSFTTSPQGECYGNTFRGSSLEPGEIPLSSYIGKCKVVIDELVGTKGTIKDKVLTSMPGFVCGGATEKEHKCKVSELGWQPSEDDAEEAGCKCAVTVGGQDFSGYNKIDAKWRPCASLSECHDTVYMVDKDIGEITKIVVKVDGQYKPQWNMQSMRITPYKVAKFKKNWTKTPINNGVYYVSTGKVQDGGNDKRPALVADLVGTTTSGVKEGALESGMDCSANSDCKSQKCDVDGAFKRSDGETCEEKCLAEDADEGAEQDKNCELPMGVASLTRCDATSCEEEMDKKFGFAM